MHNTDRIIVISVDFVTVLFDPDTFAGRLVRGDRFFIRNRLFDFI